MAQSFRFIDQETQDFLMEFSDLQNNEVVQKLQKDQMKLLQLKNNLNNIANCASINPTKKSQEVIYQNAQQTNNFQQDQQSFNDKNANFQGNNFNGNLYFQQNYKNGNQEQQSINDSYIIDKKQNSIRAEQGEQKREKENEIVKYQFKELKKKMIQRSQDQIIDEIYKHQKQLILKEATDRLDKEDPSQKSEQNCQQTIQQNNSLEDQDKFNYSVNNGQAMNHQRQQKQDILRMLNPPNYLKQKWNIIQKGIEDRLITHNEDGLPKNLNPIEKSILKEKENGYKLLKPEGEIGELEQQEEEEDEENMSNEVLITRKIVKILEEFKEVQKRDQDSIFHIALKQYCEKFHKNYDCVFTEEKDSKLKGFICEVIVDGIRLGPQLAKSKKDAKTQACMCAMARIMQQSPNMKPIEYFQKFLEQSKNKYIRLNENIAEAISQHHQQGGVPLSADNPLSDLAIAQEIPENSNYREELSIFAHKNLHKQIIWETLFDPKEKLWLAIVAVGNLSERGFGRSKKYAKNVASYKLLQRCKQLKMKDDIFKNPRKVKTQLQFALNLEQNEDEENIKQQNSLIKIKQSGKQNEQINSKRLRSQVEDLENDLDQEDEEQEQEPDLKKQQQQQQQIQQQQQQPNTKSVAQIKMKELIISLEEKYIDYYKLELSSNLNQSKINNASNTDVFKQLLKYDSEIQATKAQYQSLQNMFNEVQKKLLIDQQSQYIKKLIPIGSYVSNCMNKYSTVMDVVALLMPSQEQGENFEPNRFCDILYSEVQSTILNSNIGYFFKMELNKGCVLLVFTHNSQYKIRLIPNLVLEENILNKRKYLQQTENPLNDSIKTIIDPNESQFYSDGLLHYIWLSQFKSQIHQYESLFRILRRVFKYQGFRVPIDLIDVVVGHVSHQFSSASFQENIVGFVKFMAQNGLDDITHDNLQMVSITQLHVNQIKSCSEFELKKITEYFNSIYTKKAYDNLIII
ncbi:double-stranded RNA-binding motif protein (macronuclear) [Tetrahymena thermophila SB210]|uniref:Double-stranded RNA-binding motif protein n=1 Tax=Tetrahymena thermophila (strain SB210) TaxID=312017 RepID=I7M5X4_TETTS|nr:double-stranded RNA-binding motif protein [Tetrahymena thermophila SB210]EAR83756.1 double-stranded RNA-binding motif protein [Tetrahymena thermophila SB210]|eukprot:XP_001031419.1 double-stranded RNA-binding motif protein [Tetrahymena thermophila SB210]